MSTPPHFVAPAFLDSDRPPVPDIVVPRGVTPFHLPGRPVRGRLVRLGPLADALLSRHPYHPVVARLTGEMMALAAGLAAALKYRGSFSIQARGDGPVNMLLADCTDDGALRAYARIDQAKFDRLLAYDDDPLAAALLGVGHIAFSVDQGNDQDRYQGVVAIEGLTLAHMAQNYFRHSEQFDADVTLACTKTPHGFRASALVLERIAGTGGEKMELNEEDADEAWRTARTLGATLGQAELLDDEIAPETLLWRLFGTEGVAAGQPRALAYGCRCSRARLNGILENFTPGDLDHMAIEGTIVMTCEFCCYDFKFPRDAVTGTTAPQTEP